MNKGHSKKKGCDEMGQNTSYYCACHSFQEVMRNLTGKVVPQKTLASVMGTTTKGTGHSGIHTALAWFNKKYKTKITLQEKYYSDVGQSGVKKIVDSKNQDIILHINYRNQFGHYEVVNSINKTNNTWKIQNSLGDKCKNGCYCGYVENRSLATEKSYINGKKNVKSCLIFTKK